MSDLSTNGSFKTVSDIIHDNYPKVIPYIRSGNAGNTFINKQDLELISLQAHLKLQKSKTNLHDIIMARKGKIGGASIILENEVNFNCNENVIKLTITDKSKVNPFYFTVFFNSKYGLKQIERLSTGNVQPWVSIFQIRKLKVLILSNAFQLEIERLVKSAHAKLEESKALYAEAEKMLLDELGLSNWQPSNKNTSRIKLSEVFGISGRLDAEFYQPKFRECHQALTKYSKGFVLSDLASLSKGYQARTLSDEGNLYASIKDVTGFLIETTERTNQSDVVLVKPKTVVLAITGATIGKTGINATDENIAISGDLVGIKPNNISPYYLQTVLASMPIQELCKQYTTGATNGHLSISDVANFPIPMIENKIQESISQNVITAIICKNESKQLLELAKQAVEVAIEQDEDAAMAMIKSDTL